MGGEGSRELNGVPPLCPGSPKTAARILPFAKRRLWIRFATLPYAVTSSRFAWVGRAGAIDRKLEQSLQFAVTHAVERDLSSRMAQASQNAKRTSRNVLRLGAIVGQREDFLSQPSRWIVLVHVCAGGKCHRRPALPPTPLYSESPAGTPRSLFKSTCLLSFAWPHSRGHLRTLAHQRSPHSGSHDCQRQQRVDRHQDRSDERIHPARDRQADGEQIIKHREDQDRHLRAPADQIDLK